MAAAFHSRRSRGSEESPVTGTLASGASQPVTVTFDATGLAPGTYTANLLVQASGSASTVVTVPVTMNVTEFGLSPSTKDVDVAAVKPGDRLTYSITLTNAEPTPISAVLSDTIPGNTIYVTGNVTGGATYNAAADRIEWSGTIPAGGSHAVTFRVIADPATKGLSILNQATINHPWAYATAPYVIARVLTGADILVVEDDDRYINARGIYTDALEANGYTRYDFFPADYLGTPPTATLRTYDTIIWYGGFTKWGLTRADRAAVRDYLDSGGRLLLTGQDIAEGLRSNNFLTDTLHIRSLRDAPSGAKGVSGISGEILEGISATINTSDPDVIEPTDPLAVPIIQYTGLATGTAGVRFRQGDSRFVFLGFEFEAVTEQAARQALMRRILGWLTVKKDILAHRPEEVRAVRKNPPAGSQPAGGYNLTPDPFRRAVELPENGGGRWPGVG